MSTSGQADPEMQPKSRSREDCNPKRAVGDAGFFDNSSYRPELFTLQTDLERRSLGKQ